MEITGPARTREGLASGEFKATLSPETAQATAWSWSFEPIPGAGNNPQVPYDKPDEEVTTVTRARWFALPDDKFAAPPSCTYTLVCEATVDGVQVKGTKSWVVWIDPRGGLTTRPSISGTPLIEEREEEGLGGVMQTVWRVTGPDSLTRNPAVVSLLPPANSQFRAKIEAHENEHVAQWTNGGWSTYFDVATFVGTLNRVSSNISGEKGRASVEAEVAKKLTEFNKSENVRARNTSAQREAGAHAVSDLIAPDYRLHGH